MLAGEMKDLALDHDAFVAIFRDVPKDQFSVAYFDSQNEGAGSTSAAILEKPTTLRPSQALALLWYRDVAFSEDWDRDAADKPKPFWDNPLDSSYIAEMFQHFVKSGAFSKAAPSDGRKQTRALLDHVTYDQWTAKKARYKGFTTQCYGAITCPDAFHDRLVGNAFLTAYAVATEWNETSFFFETERDFAYVTWGTSA